MIVVSDASPLIALSTIGELEILRDLYSEIIIPQAVNEEVVVLGAGRPGSDEILEADWIDVKSATDTAQYKNLNLGDGETEAIALAIELNADLLILDEVRARREAKALGVAFIGILGILVEAKSKQVIDEVKPILRKLRDEAGFRIGKSLFERVLNSVSELKG